MRCCRDSYFRPRRRMHLFPFWDRRSFQINQYVACLEGQPEELGQKDLIDCRGTGDLDIQARLSEVPKVALDRVLSCSGGGKEAGWKTVFEVV